jgi:hypothetical protein
VGAWQRRVARARGVGALLTGAITFVQWFGDRLRAWCDGISLHASVVIARPSIGPSATPAWAPPRAGIPG